MFRFDLLINNNDANAHVLAAHTALRTLALPRAATLVVSRRTLQLRTHEANNRVAGVTRLRLRRLRG